VSSSLWNLWPDITFCLKFVVLSLWGALSDERTGLSPASHCQQYLVHSQKFNINYIVHVTCFMYMQYILDLCQHRLSTADHAKRYNSSLDNNSKRCLIYLYFTAATCFGPCRPSSSGMHNYFRKLIHLQRIRCFVLLGPILICLANSAVVWLMWFYELSKRGQFTSLLYVINLKMLTC
jgi:hypothetical protein